MSTTGNKHCKSVGKRLLSMVLVIAIVATGLKLEAVITKATENTSTTQIYLVDNTKEKWLANDSAVLELVDNSNGHNHYEMTKVNDTTWSVTVPESAYNITFNRYSPDKSTQWNSWSAGGRDDYNAYYADGSEYGHWEIIDGYEKVDEKYFHAGDIIYLDVSEFVSWEKDGAEMYINFTDASKEENGGNDINLLNADASRYNPSEVTNKVEEKVYRYIVTQEDEGAEALRFWRGNNTELWNCSIVLAYEDYKKGINCVKITGWNDIGEILFYEYEVDEEKDTDEDSVLDYLEVYFGTDITKGDTDGDDLSDYIELFVISSDPLLKDTDADGIKDGDEDADGEGITNLNELEKGTDLSKVDTDSDKLNDYEELMVYGTEPLIYDTDEDGVSDGKEVELGTNPLVKDEKFNITTSSNATDSVKASVEIVLSGDQVGSLQIEKYEDELLFPVDMPGYTGGVYDFSVNGDFESATIRFEFDSSLLADEGFEPVIYYYNEDKQLLEELETKIDGNIASAQITHFSKYILLDKNEFQTAFTWQDIWEAGDYSGVELVLVIDDSGSISRNDRYNQRLEVAKDLVENLPNNSKIGVVRFDSTTALLTSALTDNKEDAKVYLSSDYFSSNGYSTYMYEAINSSFSLFDTNEESILKMMVVLSDGDTFDTHLHLSVIDLAKDKDVKIYTVGLGNSSSYFTNFLEPLASNTGGKFYLAVNANELEDVYKDISNEIDVETDSDADGIPDYYEDNMVMFNGTKVKLDKNNPDMDGDGLLDGEEVVELNYQYNEDKTKAIVTGKFNSTPLEKDSDYDGMEDSEDKAPNSNRFVGNMRTDYAKSRVEFDMDYRWFFKDNALYNEALSVTSSLFASAIYDDNILLVQNVVEWGVGESGGNLECIMDLFGFNDVKCISLDEEYNDNHLSEIGIGYRTVSYNGEIKNVVAVVVRGTNGTIKEWSSNFDIGDISTFNITAEWKTKENHKGFDIAANRIMKLVDEYVENNDLDDLDIAYWLTGHSRGAAIANIIGAYYEKTGKTAYTYTYASPNTTLSDDAESYTTIFNIVNKDDFVPYLPMEAWGYSRYGKTTSVSIADNYEKDWEDLTGKYDYNPDSFGLQDTINAMAGIISQGEDPRVACYEYTCSKHGDGSDDGITVTNYGMSKGSREEAIDKIPDNAIPYCTITRYDGGWFFGWDFDICQTPAYFMQLLAAVLAEDIEIDGYSFAFVFDISDRYDKAHRRIISSYIGGLEHQHYRESYYLLAQKISD